MRRKRNTKIVATIGPASCTKDQIYSLYRTGVDVFRLNFSHGSIADHEKSVKAIREIERSEKHPIAILIDLQGPKLRIGEFLRGAVTLEPGNLFILDLDTAKGSVERVNLPHPQLFKALQKGTEVLLDDGNICLRVIDTTAESITTEVIVGGVLSNRKGVNIPGVSLPVSSLTNKDRADLEAGLDMGIDWVGLSFVQRAEDIAEAHGLIRGRARIISKLEKPLAIDNLRSILALSDAVMVARGDLGVEIPPEDVPSIQKRIIRNCRELGKPVIIATQMLDSMVHSPSPTRAEASDVASAVYDGVDAVMLSAESASGSYPKKSVEMMDRIIARVEQDPQYKLILDSTRPTPEHTVADAITSSARHITTTVDVSTIATFSDTGTTTMRAARERPDCPILGLTPNLTTARAINLVWGVFPQLTEEIYSFSQMVERACHNASANGLANPGEHIIVIAGSPFGVAGATNLLRIAKIDEFVKK